MPSFLTWSLSLPFDVEPVACDPPVSAEKKYCWEIPWQILVFHAMAAVAIGSPSPVEVRFPCSKMGRRIRYCCSWTGVWWQHAADGPSLICYCCVSKVHVEKALQLLVLLPLPARARNPSRCPHHRPFPKCVADGVFEPWLLCSFSWMRCLMDVLSTTWWWDEIQQDMSVCVFMLTVKTKGAVVMTFTGNGAQCELWITHSLRGAVGCISERNVASS